MRAYLVRVGIDQAFGGWNAPMSPITNEFIYVPIPESRTMTPKLVTPYALVQPALTAFESQHPNASATHVHLPSHLLGKNMHLDPDFGFLTYGDSGTKRGKELTTLARGDLLVFYSGLRPVFSCEHRLVYALIGLYQVEESLRGGSVHASRWNENAHTRCVELEASDVIIRAIPGVSGRLKQCIPVGEFRDRAYRVVPDTLDAWGGLSCKNGYLQRSAILPALLAPGRFMKWFERQKPELICTNNF